MSIFGSMTTAISGLTAQSRALGHISDNIANSSTVGFKRIDTAFESIITATSQRRHNSGAVVARPDYTNRLQGTIEQSDTVTSVAIAGQGFMAVSLPNGEDDSGAVTFDERTYYTRAGDFQLDKNGYLVNSAGYVLNGWEVDGTTNTVDRTGLQEIRISQLVSNPVATSEITFGANVPAGYDAGTPAVSLDSQIDVYDALGALQSIELAWLPTANADEWELTITAPNSANPGLSVGETITVQFGNGSIANSVPGTIDSIDDTGATEITASVTQTTGEPAFLDLDLDFGYGAQTVRISMGTFDGADGVTQFADTQYAVRTLVQNGVPQGSYSSLAIKDTGDVVINYDNGESRTIARVPVVMFNNADGLDRVDGQAFLRSFASGEGMVYDQGSEGAGQLVVEALEKSNVDIAAEFTKLIVAQRAYTANTRIVTASDEMLQDTLNMKR